MALILIIDMAKELTQKSDKILKENFLEVAIAFGKAGRADIATINHD